MVMKCFLKKVDSFISRTMNTYGIILLHLQQKINENSHVYF